MRAICLGALVLLGGCELAWFADDRGVGSTTATARRDPGTLIVGRVADAITLDPARVTDNESVEVCEQIYDTLLEYHPGSDTIEPGLATDWRVSEDGTVWTLDIRRGVTFHDGTPLDAHAVVFSLERQRDPNHPHHHEDFAYWQNSYRNIEKVEATDDFTVQITIERRYAPFEATLAMFPVAIVSPTAVAERGDEYGNVPVGTGPFRFTSWDAGRIVLERNDDYWGGAPTVERLVFQAIPDGRQRLVALESGAIDIAYSIPPEELQFVELHPQLTLYRRPANNVAYMAMNTQKPPFDDVRVRRAANYALNKEPIVKLIYQGMAIPADGPLPPSQWGYHRIKSRYSYDPDRARELLAEAAADGVFDPGVRYRLYVPSTPRPYLPDPVGVARVIRANLADVGIDTELVIQEFREHRRDLQFGNHELALFGWVGDNGDPDNFLYVLFDRENTTPGLARNVAFFRDPEVHGLLVLGQESADREQREQIYARVQELIGQQAPWVPIAHSRVVVAARSDVGGILLSPTSHVHYDRVRKVVP